MGVRNASVFTVIMAGKRNSIFSLFFVEQESRERLLHISLMMGAESTPFQYPNPMSPTHTAIYTPSFLY
jgi:hypothetical protein